MGLEDPRNHAVRLAKGAWLRVEFENGEFRIFNAQDSLVGTVAKDDTYSRHDIWVQYAAQAGPWGQAPMVTALALTLPGRRNGATISDFTRYGLRAGPRRR